MSVSQNEINRKSIQITQIDTPHKFWFKFKNESDQLLLDELHHEIKTYIENLRQQNDGHLPEIDVQAGDVIVTMKWKKWIRGKAGQLKKATRDGEMDLIYMWAIDYGCKLQIPLSSAVLLECQQLAYRHPINVHIGGLSGILPAEVEFDFGLLETRLVKSNSWKKNATERFNEWISVGQSELIFEIESNQSGRYFGQLKLHSQYNEPFSVSHGLCEINEALVDQENFMNDVEILNREDFLRLNHELTMPNENEEILVDDGMIERIWWNDDDSISLDDQNNNTAVQNELIHTESVYEHELPVAEVLPSRSGTNGNSTLNGITLSTVSVTLSVKSLNRCNLISITDDVVTPTKEWKDTFYFKPRMRNCLKFLYRETIDPLCSYGWPHIMRGNSMLLIGESFQNKLLLLPTICSVVSRTLADWTQSNRIEPIGIILVNGAEEVERMAVTCRKLVEKADMDLYVYCLNSRFEIQTLMQTNYPIDILVTSVFCFDALVSQMPLLFKLNRLQYVWFHQIDSMYQTNMFETQQAVNTLFAQDIDIQVQFSSETYFPVLKELFDSVKVPMLLTGDRTPFEAALFADCFFAVEFLPCELKIKDLIEKLQDPYSQISGSIVIVCANIQDVKYVAGCLTQSNIKCTDFDSFFSLNQLKLVNWTDQSRTLDTYLSRPNILVCEDENLNSYPIRTASHIVHYSLPNKVQCFKQRFITCFGYYSEKLDRELLIKADQNELVRPISLVYFDDNLCNEFIEIFDLITQRTECDVPLFLTDTIAKLLQNLENSKKDMPLCPDLIKKAKICDTKCPYRHTLLTNSDGLLQNDTQIPHSRVFVNMELINILAPNHFAVRLISWKCKLKHKSKPIEDLEPEHKQFERAFHDYYTCDESRERPPSILVGKMYMYLYRNRPKRCRVVSKSMKRLLIYLIDDGKMRKCSERDLYSMDEDFEDFPSRAVEMFVLGYAPNDYNNKWLPEASKFVENIMQTLANKNDSYLQAEVIRSFDRRLIVKDLKVLYKNEGRLLGKLLAENIIKFEFAVKKEIKLHPIFMDTTASSNTESQSTTSAQLTTSNNGEPCSSYMSCAPSKSDVDLKPITSPACLTKNSVNLIDISPGTTANSSTAVSVVDLNERRRFTNHLMEFTSQTIHELAAQSENSRNADENGLSLMRPVSSLDEIFGSLPEHISAAMNSVQVLTPIKCTQLTDEIDSATHTNTEDECLISFSDNDSEDTNVDVQPSPFAYVRLIDSIDDL